MNNPTKPSPTRRRALQALALSLLLPVPVKAQSTNQPFDQWVADFRARALARGVSDATYTRVMHGLKPDTTVFKELHNQPEFNEQLWQYLNRRVSDWRIVTGKQAAKDYAPLLARIEQDFGVERSVMLGVWGVESAYGDPLVQQNHMRPIIPGARGAGLGRAAPARLLGAGAAQRAGHHRSRLGQARGDERLLGRRHGPHPMDAGGLAQHGLRLRRRRPRVAVRQARRCARLDRALSGATRQVPARRALGLRGAGAGRRERRRRLAQLCGLAESRRRPAPTARPSRSRTPPRNCGCRCRAGRRSCSDRISMRCAPTIRR